MIDVTTKLRGLSTTRKICIAVAVAVLLGGVGYAVFGDFAGVLGGLGGLFASIRALFGRDADADLAKTLLEREERRLRRESDRARAEVEAGGRERATTRTDEALGAAEALGRDDGGDPRRVLRRHRDGTAGQD